MPKGYYFNSPLFYVHDNKFFINLRLDKVDSILKQNSDLYIDHIAIYKFNSKQELTFSGFQKLDLPSINKKVYGFSYISFENWNYPYVNYSNNNEIVDLLSDRKVKLFSDSLIFCLAEVNYGKQKFKVQLVKKVASKDGNNKVLAIYNIEDDFYVNVFDRFLNLEKSYQLDKNVYKDVIYIEFNDVKQSLQIFLGSDTYSLNLPVAVFL